MLTFHFVAPSVDTQVCTTHTDLLYSLVHAYLHYLLLSVKNLVWEREFVHTSICNYLLVSALYLGVVTFCHSSATPCAAEEGLTGVLGEGREDSVGCHGQWKEFTPEEVGSTELNHRQYLRLIADCTLYNCNYTRAVSLIPSLASPVQ